MNQEPNSRRAVSTDAREGILRLQAGEDVNNQTALRDRIAEALLDHLSRTADIRPGRDGDLAFMPEVTDAERLRLADAVLAVLPAPDRAAVLNRAADGFDRHAVQILDGVGNKAVFVAKALRDQAAVWREAAETLRRLAAEAPHAVTPDALPFTHVDDDGDRLEIGAVMASTYDGEAPVVYVAAEQGQGDQVATVYVRPERVERVIAAMRAARRAAEVLPAVVAQPGKEN